MLRELRIKNYAVIEELDVRPRPGLNVLTGETGAGKSIIVGALSLLLGERASSDVIRADEKRAVVEAVFDVSGRSDLLQLADEHGVEVEDDWLVLKREVQAEGRNRAWINGSPATAGLTGSFGQALVELHGQHEHQALLHAGPQRQILDSYADAGPLAEELEGRWSQLSQARRRISEVEERRARTEERAELLRHQLQEIDELNIEGPEEDEKLAARERRLAHAEEILERADRLHRELYAADGSLLERLGGLRRELDALAQLDDQVEARFSELYDNAYYAVQELGERLASYREDVDLDPARLERIRARLHALYKLKSKHGPTLQDVLDTARTTRDELDALDAAEFELKELRQREEELSEEVRSLAERLTVARQDAAGRLAREVSEILPELGMPDGRFEVDLRPRSEIGSTGAEEIAFLVTLNKGFEPRPLAKVASGGELSRVMLALKTILARLDRTPTLIFDEIDAGIGGKVGQKVAERLRAVAEHHQVFVITHLPQIAALADHHLLVEKGVARAGKTATRVTELEGEDRVSDVARMLGGDPEREASLEHARALLQGGTGARPASADV